MLARIIKESDAVSVRRMKRAVPIGGLAGAAQFLLLSSFAFFFWYGAELVQDGEVS